MKVLSDLFTTATMKEATWTEISALLQERIDSGHYKVWIQPLTGRFDGTELVVHAVSPFSAGFVRDNFLLAIREAALAVIGADVPVRLTDTPSQEAVASAPLPTAGQNKSENIATPAASASREGALPVPARQVMGQHSLSLQYREGAFSINSRAWRHSFDDFVVGPCNEMAFVASRDICMGRGRADTLFLSSPAGLGKTHLMQAVGQQLYKECNYSTPKVEYLTAEYFTSHIVTGLRDKSINNFTARYRDVDVLLLEDVHFLQGKKKSQEELLSILKTLQDRGSRIVLSSSFLPRDLRNMDNELLSRLHSGLFAIIDRPDSATRKKIFKEKARHYQVALPEDVSDFLAENVSSDVRQIESCLQNLALWAKHLRCSITMQMAWKAVQHYAPCEKKLDLENILAYVSQSFGVSLKQMHTESRKKNLVAARKTVFFLARKHTDLSLAEIGNIFGKRHSTVIKGITSLESEMSRETPLGRQIASAIAIIERNGGIISPSS